MHPLSPRTCYCGLTLMRRHPQQRAQVSELQQQNAQLSASAKRAEAEVLKSVAALKAVKETRAFSTNQKVALGLVWVGGASRHRSLRVWWWCCRRRLFVMSTRACM